MIYSGISNATWSRAVVTEPFITYDDAFTPEELLRITAQCEDGEMQRATTFGGDDERSRRCDVRFVHLNGSNAWFFDKLNRAINTINSAYYGFDLNGYDYVQYTRYDASERGTYGWHMDMFVGGRSLGLPADMIQPRKLSITLALNDDYDGGEFQVNLGEQSVPMTVPSRKGRIIAFPGFIIHSVRPVTRGYRRSIVAWITGPKWR